MYISHQSSTDTHQHAPDPSSELIIFSHDLCISFFPGSGVLIIYEEDPTGIKEVRRSEFVFFGNGNLY